MNAMVAFTGSLLEQRPDRETGRPCLGQRSVRAFKRRAPWPACAGRARCGQPAGSSRAGEVKLSAEETKFFGQDIDRPDISLSASVENILHLPVNIPVPNAKYLPAAFAQIGISDGVMRPLLVTSGVVAGLVLIALYWSRPGGF